MSYIIIFNGASSSGKSTFIKSLIPYLNTPYYHYSSDKLVDAGILPVVNRREENKSNSWNVLRPKFFDGFHRSIKAFADAGNNLVVEHIIENKEWLIQLAGLLKEHKVYFVGVFCPIDEIEKRELQRGDRFLGEGRSHLDDGIHTFSKYDLEINTFSTSEEKNIGKVVKLISEKNSNGIFDKILRSKL